jgi:hypothetical protein
MEKMYEVGFELLEDGSISLEQSNGYESPVVVWLHPEQMKFITRRMCGMDSATAASVEDLERKIAVLADRLERLVDAKWFRSSIVDSCGDGVEIMARLDGLLDLAIEFDGGRLLASDALKEEAEPKPPKPSKFKPSEPPLHMRKQPDLLG